MRDPFSVRERRYPIQIDVRYRHSGDRDWYFGRTENISRGGILIRTGGVTIPPFAPIEILLDLPPEVGGGPGMPVIGRGVVVRTEPRRHDAAGPAVAAIVEYVTADVPATDPRRI